MGNTCAKGFFPFVIFAELQGASVFRQSFGGLFLLRAGGGGGAFSCLLEHKNRPFAYKETVTLLGHNLQLVWLRTLSKLYFKRDFLETTFFESVTMIF